MQTKVCLNPDCPVGTFGPSEYDGNGKRWQKRLFCSRACRNSYHAKKPTPLAERFWSKVNIKGEDECWPWMAGKDEFGYGRVWTGQRVDGSNRVAWELTHGPIPDGEGYHGTCVLHKCDNPPCCNPKHLRLGSNAENLKDMTQKGRHGMAKLVEQDVLEIRRLYAVASVTQTELARLFGVTHGMISMIVNRKNWTHI